MASNFEIIFCLSERQKRDVWKNFCLKIKILWYDGSLQEKYFFYCVHCGKILSRTGMFYHRENMSLTGEEINRFVVDFFVNMERHKNFIKQEFEKRFAEGRMNKRTRGDQERDVIHHILFIPAATQQRPQPPVRTPRRRLRMTPKSSVPSKTSLMKSKTN